ncbi:CLUMA_CG005909, isoform A [Clunio marinus]|uniref:CLUMA_CG005909, isoform A n=1 Tax=Clunio marinus TaxID=568069 RepID=A0A1J1HWH0_9DIPT|nr:CLUMA_CG005909, isoform A [Clunio marinus]
MRHGSFLYNLWQKPPLAVIMQVFLFNITNAEEFLSGVDKKLNVVEVGPYVYQEVLENKNAVFHKNGTLSFTPERYVIPIPERSIGDPNKDIVIAANLPLLGLSAAAKKVSSFAALAVSTLSKSTNSQPLLNLTVHDFLWGYQDNLVSLANTVLPNYINFDRFGLMDRMFDEGHNVVSMNLPEAVKNVNEIMEEEIEDTPVSLAQVSTNTHDVEYEDYDETDMFNGIQSLSQIDQNKIVENGTPKLRDYSIDLWNGSPGMKHWGYDEKNLESNTQCNTLRGVYDGTLFPKNISKTDGFRVYRKAFCRTLPIQYSHSGRQYGIEGYWFKLSDNAFHDSIDDPETSCYCSKEKTCMKRGLGNITPCYYNIPTSLSLPHFYNSDPTLVDEVNGIKPVKEKHESIIVMQPRLGVPIKVHTRIQLNLMCGETMFNGNIKRFDNLILPVVWMEIAIEKLTPSLDVILKMCFIYLPVVQNIIIGLLVLGGFFSIVLMFLHIIFSVSEKHQTNLRFNSIKYTAVFPFIKQEIAKFDERDREMVQKVESV